MEQLRRGTTTTAILKVLAEEPMYAYQIIRVLEHRSRGLFAFQEGLVYPTLHRMEKDDLLTSDWRVEEGRRRKYYALTAEGRRRLTSDEQELRTFTRGIRHLFGDSADGASEATP